MSEFDIDTAHRVPTRNQNCAAAELQEDPSLLYPSSRGALREMVSWRSEGKLADYCPRALTSRRIVSSASRFTPI